MKSLIFSTFIHCFSLVSLTTIANITKNEKKRISLRNFSSSVIKQVFLFFFLLILTVHVLLQFCLFIIFYVHILFYYLQQNIEFSFHPYLFEFLTSKLLYFLSFYFNPSMLFSKSLSQVSFLQSLGVSSQCGFININFTKNQTEIKFFMIVLVLE